MARPLRVLLDARMLLGRFSGVARVVTELVAALAQQSEIEVSVLCGNEPYMPWAGRSDVRMILTGFRRRHRTPMRRHAWEELHLRRIIRDAKADVYHATWNSGIPAQCPVPAVLTIHDLIPWHVPRSQFRGPVARWCYRRSVRQSARRAALVTTVSEFTRQDVVRTLRRPAGSVLVVPNGIQFPPVTGWNDGEDRGQPSSQAPTLLYVGGHEPRKNLETVFQALEHHHTRFGGRLVLRMTGTPETLAPRAKVAYVRAARASEVHFLGTLKEDELSKEYASASLLLLLSRAEGFGLPVLEAMAHGCPVIAANRSSLPEVVGEAGLLVDPDEPAQVADAVERLLTDHPLRRDLAARGRQRAAQFAWSRIAACYAEIYDRVVIRRDDKGTLAGVPRFSPRAFEAPAALEPAGSRP